MGGNQPVFCLVAIIIIFKRETEIVKAKLTTRTEKRVREAPGHCVVTITTIVTWWALDSACNQILFLPCTI